MKRFLKLKIFLILLLLLFAKATKAEDFELGDYSRGVDNAWYGQKQITDEDFEKTIKRLEDKKNKKKNKKFKGQGLKEEDHSDHFNEIMENYNLLPLTVNLITSDGIEIPTGHYKITAKKEKKGVYIDFYQADMLVARLNAIETKNDFAQNSINFVKILPYDERFIKLIYGSVDLNVYSIIQINQGANLN